MGLTIHFTLLLPSMLSLDEATARIAKLHQAIATLPMQSQTPMVRLDEARIQQALSKDSDSPWRWAAIQYQRGLKFRHDHLGIPYLINDHEPGVSAYYRRIPAQSLIGFTCHPGDGCEDFNVFVGSYPASIMADCVGNQHGYSSGKRRLMMPLPRLWLGSAFCKTQYASLPEYGGVTNFLRCHLLVIAALDAAKAAGFEVLVKDESGYWEQRSIPGLIRQITDWNAFLLTFGEQLRTAFGDQMECAITPEKADVPVNTAMAVQLGDDVLDLIARTKGRMTDQFTSANATS